MMSISIPHRWIVAGLAASAPVLAGIFSFAIYLNFSRNSALLPGQAIDWSVAPAAIAYAMVCVVAGGAVLFGFAEKVDNGGTAAFRKAVVLMSVLLVGVINLIYLILMG